MLAVGFLLAAAVFIEALEQPERQLRSSASTGTGGDNSELLAAQEARSKPLSDEALKNAKRSPELGQRHFRIVDAPGGQIVLCKNTDCSSYLLWRPQRLRYYRTANLYLEGGLMNPLWNETFSETPSSHSPRFLFRLSY